jgi:hypothetical protein
MRCGSVGGLPRVETRLIPRLGHEEKKKKIRKKNQMLLGVGVKTHRQLMETLAKN